MESDEELMEAVARGGEDALAALVDRYAAPLHGYLTQLTRSRDDADDLLQDLWIRVARGARRFDSRRRFRPWVYGIATNLARDLFRRRAVRARAPLDPEPAAAAPAREERLDLRARLAKLPDRLRAVIVLRYYQDLGEAEMAEALGIPPGTVKSRLHAAVRELRSGYEETS